MPGPRRDRPSAPRFTAATQGSLATDRPDPAGTPTTVGIGLIVIDLLSIRDSTESFEADLFVTMTWRDPRLAHRDQSSSTVRRITTSSIWTPEVELFNRREDVSLLPNEVDVDGAGNVFVRRRIVAELTSPLDLLRFPRDRQALPVRLASSRYGPEEVSLEVDPTRYSAIEPFSVAG